MTTAADLHAAVRGMPLPEGMTFDCGDWWVRTFDFPNELLPPSIAELALKGHFSDMLDDVVFRRCLPWWKCEPGGGGPWRVSFAHNDETIADGPTKLKALVAALKALGVGSDPGAMP